MGTRHITVVRANKEVKVAQYGQWDGYPSGQGQTIADFLKIVDLKKFKKQVLALKKHTKKSVDKIFREAGWDGKSEWVSGDVSDKKNKAHPELDRDHGARILQMIHDGIVTKVKLDPTFDAKTGKIPEDDIWIEYWYELDLDKEMIRMNGGKWFTFNQWRKKGFLEKLEKKAYEE